MTVIMHKGATGDATTEGLGTLSDMLSIFSSEQNEIFNSRFVTLGRAATRCPRVIMLIGFPAAGKSTWTQKYLEKTDRPTIVASSDAQVEAFAKANGLTYNQAISKLDSKQTEAVMSADIHAATKAGSDIIIDRTNLRLKPRNRWLTQIPRHYVRMGLVFNIPPNELKDRLAARAQATGKFIPPDVVKNMIETYQPPSLAEFDILEFFDTTDYYAKENCVSV